MVQHVFYNMHCTKKKRRSIYYQASYYNKHNATNHTQGASRARTLGFRCLACFASHPVSAGSSGGNKQPLTKLSMAIKALFHCAPKAFRGLPHGVCLPMPPTHTLFPHHKNKNQLLLGHPPLPCTRWFDWLCSLCAAASPSRLAGWNR
jgi:hypothetical protein